MNDAKPQFDRRMLEALVCPITQSVLHYDKDREELVSKAAGLAFPVRGGIPILLEDEARPLD
ncbi:Trm112 family protein [Pseudothioclava nitratireducens]|uniref:Trm112 family protein n=1 Tax=Pseudothioclava nitratireducens TaxID=1928646 RepID=UPI0023D9F618|nr:Trm112 family protein [Defluviimonas nitratireducens]MDF1620328.1 Trm112 family protein [Defluviimonas nitratireducens]